MIGIIVGAVVLAIFIALGFAIYKSLTYIGPTEVGLPTKRFGAKLNPGNLDRLRGRGRLSGRAADARAPLQARGRSTAVDEVPVGAGAGRRDRRRDRAGRRAAADRRQERRVPRRRSATSATSRRSSRRRPEGRAAAGAAAGHARADPSGRVPRDHVADGLRRAGVARRSWRADKRGNFRPASFGLDAGGSCTSSQITPERQGRDLVGVVTALEGDPLAEGRHRQPPRRLRGRQGARARAAQSHAEIIGALLGTRTTCTTTTRTSRRSSTTAAASASSTTRCSTAPTC